MSLMMKRKPLPTDRKIAIFKMPTKRHQELGVPTILQIIKYIEQLLQLSPRLKVWREGNWIEIYGPPKYDDTVEEHLTAALKHFSGVQCRIEWVADSVTAPAASPAAEAPTTPPTAPPTAPTDPSRPSSWASSWVEEANLQGVHETCPGPSECDDSRRCGDTKRAYLMATTPLLTPGGTDG